MAESARKRHRSSEPNSGTEPAPPSSKLKLNHARDSRSSAAELKTISDLIQTRASEPELKDKPIVYYPSIGTNYVGYSPIDILELSNRAATYYNKIVPARTSSDEPPQVVALLGPSNFDYFIGLLGLSRLGHTILFLSTRLSEDAHVSLLQVSKATYLFVDDTLRSMGDKVSKHCSKLLVHPIASRRQFNFCKEYAPSNYKLDPRRESGNVAWIIHSSGSTSLPRPNYQTHAAALGNFKSQFRLTGFVTLPLFHMQGLGCVFRSIMNRKPIYMYNAALPLTSQHLKTTLRDHPDIQILYGVPHAMKLLGDSEEGIELCQKLDVLFCGGGACPKPIGDNLTKNGVYLVSHYGSSETGQLMNSYRPRSEIEEWDWLRPSPALQPYLRWEPYDLANNIFEMVILEGWPSKVATNRADGSYATKDLWEQHPDYPQKNAWRYYARKDDTIVLSNGEKANPIAFEDAARESPLVDDAIVFGSQKPHLGLFLVPTNTASTESMLKEQVWRAVQKANELAPAHAQIAKDMIHLLSYEDSKRIKRTDKAGLVRVAFYKEFAGHIDALYEETRIRGSLVLDQDGLKSFLRKQVEAMIESDRRDMIDDEMDLFSLGVDSLQASRIRSAILRNIDIGQEEIGMNFVFDFPSIEAMAAELFRLRVGAEKEHGLSIEDRLTSLIHKYSINFPQHRPCLDGYGHSVLVTGATGSLGAHVLAQLATRTEISKILCPVRARSNSEAMDRVRQSLRERQLSINVGRIEAFEAELSNPLLGLTDAEYVNLTEDVSCIFHCAWTVNFNLGLESFERSCIKGTRHLIDLCLKSKRARPADFIFCSSISTYANIPTSMIPEELPPSLDAAQNTGYSQSKLVAEYICSNASRETRMHVRVMRIGQIVGDTRAGVWNCQEAIPLIIQSARTVGALPTLNEQCSWLPVNTVAGAVSELWWKDSDNQDPQQAFDVYNIVNSNTFHWTRDLLPMLKISGLEFDAVDTREWLSRLKQRPDVGMNPPYKLIEFFSAKYNSDLQKPKPTYASDKARTSSPILADAPGLEQVLIDKYVRYIISKLT